MGDGDRDRDTGGVPVITETEASGRVSTAVRIAVLETELRGLVTSLATKEYVRSEVTGARTSIERAFDKKVAAIAPPAFWKVAAGVGALLLALATIVWQASSRVSDLATQNLLLQQRVSSLEGAKKP